MRISFTPAVGETLLVSKPPLTVSTVVPLQFTAKLDAQDYHELKCNGGRIQLWSDLPMERRSLGEWGEFDFQGDEDEPINPRTVVNLVRYKIERSHEHLSKDSSVSLRLYSYLPVKAREYSPQFSFTYRIVYPSGEIKWLGQFGQNGVIRTDEEDSSASEMTLEDGWTENGAGSGCIQTLSSKTFGGRTVMKLERPCDYQAWALGKAGFLSQTRDASLVFLVPAASSNPVIMGQTYIFGASSGATLSADSTGVFSASGGGTLSLYIYDVCLDAIDFINRILTSHAHDICRSLACAASPVGKHVVLASSKENLPIKVFIIPLGPIGPQAKSQVNVPLATLRGSLTADNDQFSIFCPLTLDAHFFWDGQLSDAHISFIVERSGSQVLLSPVHDLSEKGRDAKAARNQCNISILSAHTLGQPSSGDDTVALPTPPPSPLLRPIARLSSASSETEISSVSSLPEETIAPAIVVGTPTVAIHTPTAAVLAVRPRQPPRSLAYIRYYFAMAGLILRMIYRLFFGSIRDVADSDNGDEVDAKVNKTHLVDSHEGDTSPVVSDSSAIHSSIRERSISPSPDASLPEQDAGPGHDVGPEQTIIQDEDFIDVSSPNTHYSSEISSQPLISPSLHVQLATEASVVVAFVIRMSSGAGATELQPGVDDIRSAIEMNGQVPQSVVQKCHSIDLADGSDKGQFYLLEFDGGKGGWIKISPPAVGGQLVPQGEK